MNKIMQEKIDKEMLKYEDSLALPEWDNKKIHGIDFQKGAIFGYDQAMQDFMEKACVWLIKKNRGQFVEQFKRYMQDESEN